VIGLGEEMNHAHVRSYPYKLPVWLRISPALKCGASGQGQSPEHCILIDLGSVPCSHTQASELLLASGESVFSGQSLHTVDPFAFEYVLVVQSVYKTKPVAVLYFLAGHAAHADLPESA